MGGPHADFIRSQGKDNFPTARIFQILYNPFNELLRL